MDAKTSSYFIRTMMAKGVLSEIEATKVMNGENGNYELENMISSINSQIRPMGQELKIVRDEVSGKRHVVILWTGGGEAALSQTLYTQQEVTYWRKLLEEIATAEGKRINSIRAMNSAENITKSRVQELMEEWTAAHYLSKMENGEYILGLRGIHEFESYLRLNMPDVLDVCMLCTKPVFQSIQCDHCGKYFHKFCLQIALEKMDKWPCCKEAYRDLATTETSIRSQPSQNEQEENEDITMDDSL